MYVSVLMGGGSGYTVRNALHIKQIREKELEKFDSRILLCYFIVFRQTCKQIND